MKYKPLLCSCVNHTFGLDIIRIITRALSNNDWPDYPWERWRRGNRPQLKCALLRWARGKPGLDHVRNVDIWKEAHMYPMAEFLREKRLRWFGHVQRRDKDEATRKILQMTVDGSKIEADQSWDGETWWKRMARNQMTTETVEDRKDWHVMIRSRHTTKCRGG